jgi:transposase
MCPPGKATCAESEKVAACESQCKKNQAGKPQDCLQVAFGLVLDGEGFVVRHAMFPGNTHDARTLLGMVESLRGDEERPLVVVDGGMATQDNLEKLTAAGYDYITVKKRPTRLAYEPWFAEPDGFTAVRGREGKPPILVKALIENGERLVCCYSEARAAKEESILSRAEARFLRDSQKLQGRVDRGRLKRAEAIHRAIGRLQERHPRVARFYQLSYFPDENRLDLARLDEKFEQARQVVGGYVLRTNRLELDDEQIWKIYIMLTRLEAAFRSLKSTLSLRPIFHQKTHRSDGHIFIAVLAYHLLHWIEHHLRANGIYHSWPTIRRLLETHCYTTIVCPTVDGRVYHIRKPGEPDTDQKKIYHLLGVPYRNLPRRTIAI